MPDSVPNPRIVSHAEVRNRLEQVKLSYEGYKRQLDRLDLSAERRERLETDVRLLGEETSTLEKLAQLGRVEPDRANVQAAVEERLAALRERLSTDPSLSRYSAEARDMASGEIRALQWALREDKLTLYTEELMKGHDPDPSKTDRAVPTILIHTLEEGPNVDARASAAYDLGKLHIVKAIPALATALDDDPFVAEMAFGALCRFTDEELAEAKLDGTLLERVRAARS